MRVTPGYPTPQHERAAVAVADVFSRQPGVEAVLVMGSCARGKASPDSCLDMLVLLRPEALKQEGARLEAFLQEQLKAHPALKELPAVGAFSIPEVGLIDGVFTEPHHGYTSGADEFELEVGNTLAYTYPLWEGGTYYQELKSRWLPYYDDEMRARRLEMVIRYCRNNLAHIPLYAPRGLPFQCFKRFYHAFEEFLQALFIAHRKYPIAYDKWVQEGVTEVLGMPELYAELPELFEIDRFESLEIVEKARRLEHLLEVYVETRR